MRGVRKFKFNENLPRARQVHNVPILPRRGHVPHGSALRPPGRRGPRAAGVRGLRAEGGRRLHHAGDHLGQHGGAHCDDWGEGGRHNQTDLRVGRIPQLRLKEEGIDGAELILKIRSLF